MRQFDIYVSPDAAARVAPYLVVLTSHHLSLRLVLVAPLLADALVIQTADVPVRFGDAAYVLSLMEMAAVEPNALKRRAGSVSDQEDVISRALNRLFTGF